MSFLAKLNERLHRRSISLNLEIEPSQPPDNHTQATEQQDTSPPSSPGKMSQQPSYSPPALHTSTLSLLRIYTTLLSRARLHLADWNHSTNEHLPSLHGAAREVLDEALHPEFYKVMCNFVWVIRQERGASEQGWAERVAGKIEELEECMGREREVNMGEGACRVWVGMGVWYPWDGRRRRASV